MDLFIKFGMITINKLQALRKARYQSSTKQVLKSSSALAKLIKFNLSASSQMKAQKTIENTLKAKIESETQKSESPSINPMNKKPSPLVNNCCDQSACSLSRISKKCQYFERILTNNKRWADNCVSEDPEFFSRLVGIQRPDYLWVGCADSRVPANEIVGLKPGQLFVHRNVANQVPLSDINVLAVIQYSVQVLQVKNIIVTGHYGCGGIKAAFRKHDHGPLEAWLSHIRQLRGKHKKQLILSQEENEDLLTELNVKNQVLNVAKIPVVQKAWKEGRMLNIYGLVYRLNDGILKDLGVTLKGIQDLPQQFRIIE